MKLWTCVVLIGLCLNVTAADAQTPSSRNAKLSPESQQALQETQDLLRDPKRFEKEGLTNPQARAAHQKLRELMGSPEDTQAVMNLSADVFGDLVKAAEGDPNRMQEILKNAVNNPEAFANTLSREQKTKLEELAKKVQSRSPAAAPPR